MASLESGALRRRLPREARDALEITGANDAVLAVVALIGIRLLHDDERGLEFVLKPRVGGSEITLDEASLVEGGFPFVLMNY